MPSLTEWRVPPANQPRASDYAFDLDRTLLSVVGRVWQSAKLDPVRALRWE